MRIQIIAVGRLKAGPERELVLRYAERFEASARALGMSGPLISELAESQARSAMQRKHQEAEAILAALPEGFMAMRLDERGEMTSSDSFASRIRNWRDEGRRGVSFIIGGADGLAEDVTARAPLAICFGRMTVPHQLARVLLLEQLYRTATILSGHPYHRA